MRAVLKIFVGPAARPDVVRTVSVVFSVAAAVLLWTAPAAAQTGGSLFGSGSSGLFSSGGTGGSSTAGGAARGTGATGGGATAAGGTRTAGGLNLEAGTGGVNTTFSGGFVGRSDNAGRFVGQQQAGAQQGTSAQNFGSFGLGGLLGRAFGQNFGGGNFGSANASDPRQKIRTQQRIAFRVPPSSSPLSVRLPQQLSRFRTRHPQLAGVTVEVTAPGQVRLTGSVPDADTGRLAEQLLRMEPGVAEVSNEVQIVGTSSSE